MQGRKRPGHPCPQSPLRGRPDGLSMWTRVTGAVAAPAASRLPAASFSKAEKETERASSRRFARSGLVPPLKAKPSSRRKTLIARTNTSPLIAERRGGAVATATGGGLCPPTGVQGAARPHAWEPPAGGGAERLIDTQCNQSQGAVRPPLGGQCLPCSRLFKPLLLRLKKQKSKK